MEGSLNNVKKPKSNKLNRPKIKIKKKSKKWQIYWGIISDKSSGIEVYMRNGHGKYKKFRKINTTKKLKKSKRHSRNNKLKENTDKGSKVSV